MGAGIAQVAAMHEWVVHLKDVDDETSQRAIDGIAKRFDRLVEKGRMSSEERDAAVARLHVAHDLSDCSLIIEAIVENLDVKAKVLGDLVGQISETAIIATNTSSLSVSDIGQRINQPHRTVGMHFFNPAPLMKLVEVIAGKGTDSAVVDRVASIAKSWGKHVARAADVPGFIVNHVARPYYLEAFRILEQGYATVDEIDRSMRDLGEFRMGPFQLVDLIGMDINSTAARSVWEQLDKPPLLTPNPLQERIVADGHLGRKTKRGMYDYTTDPPVPAVTTTAHELSLPASLSDLATEFAERSAGPSGSDLENYIVARIVIAIIAQAAHARARGVAETADIDTAMKYGVNYPLGPFEWADRVGLDLCRSLLRALNETVDDDRFAGVPL